MGAKKVTFRMFKDKDYKILHVDGAFGGITGGSLITCDLYAEKILTPEETTIEINEAGQIIRETNTPANPPVDRIVQIGLVMTPAAARALGEWLIRNATEVAGQHAMIGSMTPGLLPN